MGRKKSGGEPPIYKPRRIKDEGTPPLYIELNSPEIPDLAQRFRQYLKEIRYKPTAYVRWLVSYAIAHGLRPTEKSGE